MRDQILALIEQGKSYRQIALLLGCSKGTIAYHVKRTGAQRRVLRKYDWIEIREYYDEGHSGKECCRHFGCAPDTFGAAVRRGDIQLRPKLPLEELKHRAAVRTRIVKDGLLPYECMNCSLIEWLGKPLALELHHINGISDDHRLENLCFLCPNCHSQTPNHGGRAKTAIMEAA